MLLQRIANVLELKFAKYNSERPTVIPAKAVSRSFYFLDSGRASYRELPGFTPKLFNGIRNTTGKINRRPARVFF